MSPTRNLLPAWVLLPLMFATGIGGFLVIRGWGETLSAPAATFGTASAADHGMPLSGGLLFHVLLALTTVIAAGRILGHLFVYLGQAPVIGEVVAGILLGPTLLARVAPDLAGYLLPAAVAPYLSVLGQLGAILYMFQVGLELDLDMLRSRARPTVAVSQTGMLVPFLMGAALALVLYPRFSNQGVSFTAFALFMGVAMAITAFPVLARILTDWGLSNTPMGTVALAAAATGDVTAWCLLAVVVGVAQSQMSAAVLVISLTLGYCALMSLLVGPLLSRVLVQGDARVGRQAVSLMFLALLVSSLLTEWIGVHAIFGAFLLGAVIPHESAVAHTMKRSLDDLVAILLLPAFFAFTGMRTQIGLVAGWENWIFCGLIIVVATVGKFGGTMIAGRMTGMSWRESSLLGALMNARGLMELIVLNIGLDLGIISPTVFAMMVLMALVTTISTAPMLRLLGESGHKR